SRDFEGFSPKLDAVFEQSLTAMTNAGATPVVVFFPHFSDIFSGHNEVTVLLSDFKIDIQNYPATRTGVPTASGTLADLIAASNCRLPKHQCTDGHDLPRPSRNIVLQHSLQRTNIDQANIWLRGGDTRKASAPVPPDATLLRAKSNSRPSPPTDQTHSTPSGKSPVV